MKKTLLALSCVALLATLPAAVRAEDTPAKAPAASAAKSMPAPPPAAPSALDPLKKLEGTWTGKAGHGDEAMDVTVNYHVTAAGSAVIETLFPGTPHEMVTVYTLDGTRVVLTHYCAMGNQPHMAATAASTDKELVFDFAPSPGIDPAKDAHMHSAKIQFVDADHLHNEWTSFDKGAATGTAVFELARSK